VASNVCYVGHELVSDAQAKVAGMDHRDLRRDRDFKKAVRYVVENDCSISGGYVDDGYLYGASISCY
jgi:hypothetical protein